MLHQGYSLTQEVAGAGSPVVEFQDSARFDVKRAVGFRKFLRAGGFDVVHSSLWGCNAFTRLAAAGWRRPAIVVSELSVEDWRPQHRRVLDRALRPLIDPYVANSRDVRDFICRAHGIQPNLVTVNPEWTGSQHIQARKSKGCRQWPCSNRMSRWFDLGQGLPSRDSIPSVDSSETRSETSHCR
jgi:hypothetical protein